MIKFLQQKKIGVLSEEPTIHDGKDGDFVLVVTITADVFLYYKHDGHWYRLKFERI